jgi:hypothetical protein
MAKLNFSIEAYEAVKSAELSAEGAARALALAARIIRSGEPLPLGMDRWVADAFDAASRVDADSRGKVLANRLRISGGHRRPKADWVDVGKRVEELIPALGSQTKAVAEAAEEFDVSERTVRSNLKTWRLACEEHDRITDGERAHSERADE